MIAATDLLLAAVDRGRLPDARRPRVLWLSADPHPAVVDAGRRLGLDVRVVPVDEGTGALELGDGDLLTADATAVGCLGPGGIDGLDRRARRVGACCPNAVALGLAADPGAARAALAAAGFPVTGDGGPGGTRATVAVARRPSGWWRPVPVAGQTGESDRSGGRCTDPRLLELAASAAAGLDVAGVLALDVVVEGDAARIAAVHLGPRPDDTAAVEAHLRGLLDLPLGADPVGLDR